MTQQSMPTMGNLLMVENIIVTQNDHPLSGVFVTLGNAQVQTNDKGIASFDNVYEGNQKIYLYYKKQTEIKTVNITGQNTTVTFDATHSLSGVLITLSIILIIVFVVGIIVRQMKNK